MPKEKEKKYRRLSFNTMSSHRYNKNSKWRRKRREKILREQDWKCNICGWRSHKNEWYTLDHIVPLVDGGTWDEDNLQVLCKHCHSSKTKKENQERS